VGSCCPVLLEGSFECFARTAWLVGVEIRSQRLKLPWTAWLVGVECAKLYWPGVALLFVCGHWGSCWLWHA
jgi:hypothetical protein